MAYALHTTARAAPRAPAAKSQIRATEGVCHTPLRRRFLLNNRILCVYAAYGIRPSRHRPSRAASRRRKITSPRNRGRMPYAPTAALLIEQPNIARSCGVWHTPCTPRLRNRVVPPVFHKFPVPDSCIRYSFGLLGILTMHKKFSRNAGCVIKISYLYQLIILSKNTNQ